MVECISTDLRAAWESEEEGAGIEVGVGVVGSVDVGPPKSSSVSLSLVMPVCMCI